MKTRVILALSLLPLLLMIVLLLPPWATAVLVAAMCVLASYEFLVVTKQTGNLRLVVYSMLSGVAITFWSCFGCHRIWGAAIVFMFFAALFVELLTGKTELSFQAAFVTAFTGLVIPYMLSALVRILNFDHGRIYILVAFALAFVSDSGAYFVGLKFGKHKLAPVISPKKTVEGFAGGIGASVLFMCLFCLVVQLIFDYTMDYVSAVLYGVLGSLGSVMGDLVFSVVKRQRGIKDYGKILPGHGGILDRFDSMVVVAPLTELLIMVLPLIVKVGL